MPAPLFYPMFLVGSTPAHKFVDTPFTLCIKGEGGNEGENMCTNL